MCYCIKGWIINHAKQATDLQKTKIIFLCVCFVWSFNLFVGEYAPNDIINLYY